MALRRRSKISQNNKGIFKKAFSNEPVRLLGIPQIINDYNYHKTKLFDRGTRLCNAGAKRKRLDNVVVAKESSYRSANLYKQAKTCVLCTERGRRQHKSQPHRSPRPPQRTPRTRFGCSLCQLPMCRPKVRPECWQEHLRRLQTIKLINTTKSSIIK
ncbi:hypothetical protein BU23DRAFT_549434 [Bimuria novae-zelandiae CBS 107.79]|uniref:Uncharacterized protein n=1 Tax=Bimuria novae-zelandiae CBS 107.79 TaxID=1447943 RepID=A0A6A5VQ55_9PLEO|nr:hypothetical protein BU23DRAFT_549434 [Bimuria novae-zelandiae CBS 107.79]